MTEPKIIINGCQLTPAQAMTVRVALGSFAIDLQGDGLGTDEHGKAMTAAYRYSIGAINRLMRTSAEDE